MFAEQKLCINQIYHYGVSQFASPLGKGQFYTNQFCASFLIDVRIAALNSRFDHYYSLNRLILFEVP